ncbi:hypothetical protein H8959_001076 [Pygathrix nigripes]
MKVLTLPLVSTLRALESSAVCYSCHHEPRDLVSLGTVDPGHVAGTDTHGNRRVQHLVHCQWGDTTQGPHTPLRSQNTTGHRVGM